MATRAIDWTMFPAVPGAGPVRVFIIIIFFIRFTCPFVERIRHGSSDTWLVFTLTFHLVLDHFEGQKTRRGGDDCD